MYSKEDDKNMNQESIDNYKELAAAVLHRTVSDIREGGYYGNVAIKDVLSGGLDVYMDILGLDLTRKEFVEKTLKRGCDYDVSLY